jgi:putative membrane-bound dehydrogenase-like protein
LQEFFAMCSRRTLLALLGSALLAFPGLTQESRLGAPSKPLAPSEAVKQFRLPAGLRIELVAAEPLLESPVAMAFDPQGRIWVVEMRDYPNGPGPGQPPQGRIRILEDRDGDGFYEHGSTFAEGLLFANGLMLWKDGAIVTAAPAIVHVRDTDGAGKADRRDVLYEGFAAQNPQLRVSHPILGLDGWVYVANGLRGGKVQGATGPVIDLSGKDFRFDLLRQRAEAISGLGQFGNTFDAWSRRFVCDNRHHLRHIVLEDRYVKRNPFLAVPSLVEDVSELDDGPLNSGGKVFPLSRNWTTSNLHEGRFTAACGVHIYEGGLLGKQYKGGAFTCEPTGNLVHMEVLQPHGATFRSHPLQKGVEFLATPDDWFRPVSLATGPEGALYIVDMYRAVIEHPDFRPSELKNRPDLLLGKNRGRIWRIVPEGHKTQPIRPAIKAEAAPLLADLERAEPWWQTTAERLLLQKLESTAASPLAKLFEETKSDLARLHAAYLLDRLAALDTQRLLVLLDAANPRLREHGILLAEKKVRDVPVLRQRLLALVADADARVRFQLALTLGELDGAEVLAGLAKIAEAGSADRWTRYAVASAVPKRAGALLEILLGAKLSQPSGLLMLQELAALVGARQDKEEMAQASFALLRLRGADAERRQLAGLNGLADGLARRGARLGLLLHNIKPRDGLDPARWFDDFLAKLGKEARDPKRPADERVPMIRLFAHGSWDSAKTALLPLLTDEPSQEVRLAAVRALAAHADTQTAALLMQAWRAAAPAIRREILEAMLRQPDRIHYLLGEIAAQRVRPAEIDALRTRQLLQHARLDIRAQARKLLQGNLPKDRAAVLKEYQAALTLKGVPRKGREIFRKNCATCHKVGGIGVDVGPDISDTRTKTLEALLTDVLLPNRAIDNNFVNYLVTTKSGRSYTGLLATETASSITLKRAEGQSDVILRQDIDEIASTGVSLMPEGLEKTIPVREMADLLSYLKNWRYLDGAVPLAP